MAGNCGLDGEIRSAAMTLLLRRQNKLTKTIQHFLTMVLLLFYSRGFTQRRQTTRWFARNITFHANFNDKFPWRAKNRYNATMSVIKFGTSGWRGIISDTFTFGNVELAAHAIAQYLNENPPAGASK